MAKLDLDAIRARWDVESIDGTEAYEYMHIATLEDIPTLLAELERLQERLDDLIEHHIYHHRVEDRLGKEIKKLKQEINMEQQ